MPMHVSREIILDLLPLYAAGEASAETRALVEEYLSLDEGLRQEVDRNALAEPLEFPTTGSSLANETELRTLRRTQRLLAWQRRLYAWALTLSVLSVSGIGWIQNGRLRFHFFLLWYPHYFWPCVSLAASCWINYFFFRRRIRVSK
jgi:hypothetical protein